MWEKIQPWALHPIQRAGLDEGLDELFEFLGVKELHGEWLKL